MRSALLAASLGAVLFACGPGRDPGGDGGVGGWDGGVARDTGGVTPGPDAQLPPEREERRAFETPQAGGRFVYVANPRRNTVAVIDSMTLAITTSEAGDGPTVLRTLPGRDEAVVLNAGSDDATILRTDPMRGTRTTTLPVVRDANAVAIAPDGAHAVVYFDTDQPGTGLGSGSFQDVTVLTLTEGQERALTVSVGFRPLEVVFARDNSAAFVVTEDGVSVLRFAALTGPTIVPTIGLGDITADARTRDVSITPDGRYAVVRVEGQATVRLVDLASGEVRAFDAGTPVTDVDVAPSGEYALAALRGTSTVLRLPLPGGFSDPASATRVELAGEVVGSLTITPDGARALVYTTAAAVERVTVLDLAAPMGTMTSPRTIRLRKAVRAVAVAPDGATALVVHQRAEGDPNQRGIDLETRIDRSYGYTLVSLATGFAKLQLTDAEVGPLAIVPDGTHAFVIVRDPPATSAVRQVHRAVLASFAIEPITLGSPPLSVGVVPATQRAFVGQEHPEGRITFIDWNTGALQSVTGFELNSRIR